MENICKKFGGIDTFNSLRVLLDLESVDGGRLWPKVNPHESTFFQSKVGLSDVCELSIVVYGKINVNVDKYVAIYVTLSKGSCKVIGTWINVLNRIHDCSTGSGTSLIENP